MIKSDFYYDFYFNGQFFRRFNSLEKCQTFIEKLRPRKLTYPADLFSVRKVKRKKLSTGGKHGK